MEGPGGRWLLLHGTPLTPQVRDRVAGHLRRYGPVWAARVTGTAATGPRRAGNANLIHAACLAGSGFVLVSVIGASVGHPVGLFVSAADVAALTALAVIDPGLRGQVLELGGPDNLTFNQLAALVQETTGRPGRRPGPPGPAAQPAMPSRWPAVDGRR